MSALSVVNGLLRYSIGWFVRSVCRNVTCWCILFDSLVGCARSKFLSLNVVKCSCVCVCVVLCELFVMCCVSVVLLSALSYGSSLLCCGISVVGVEWMVLVLVDVSLYMSLSRVDFLYLFGLMMVMILLGVVCRFMLFSVVIGLYVLCMVVIMIVFF